MSAKIIKFPNKKKSVPSKSVKPVDTQATGLTRFQWMHFTKPPALYITANVKELDKILLNNSEFDPPPRMA